MWLAECMRCSKCAVYSRDKTNQNQNILITRAEIVRTLGRHGDGGVEAAVEVDDADGRVRGGVVSPQRRAAHRARAGHAPRQPLHHPGPDEHPAIRHTWVSARACNEPSVFTMSRESPYHSLLHVERTL